MKRPEKMSIEPRPSGVLAAFILSVHLGGLVAAAMVLPYQPLMIAVVPLLLWSGVGSWSRFVGKRRIRRLELTVDGGWILHDDHGEERHARLLGRSFVSSRLLVLNFSTVRWRRRTLILLPGNTDTERLRRLRIYLLHRARRDKAGLSAANARN